MPCIHTSSTLDSTVTKQGFTMALDTIGRVDAQQIWDELRFIEGELRTTQQLLRQIIQTMEMPLGFVDNEFGQLIHCDGGVETGGFWYIFDEHFNKKAIPYRAINGLIKGLRYADVREGGRAYHAMELLVCAHKPLVLRDAWNSTFARGIVAVLASMQPEELRKPLTIEIAPDASGRTFCLVKQHGRLKMPPSSPPEADFKELVHRAVQNVKTALD
jgi:hypothetical protein